VGKLRRAEVALGKGLKVPEVCRELGISEQTYYRWRQKYGGMAPEVAKQLKTLEKENGRSQLPRNVLAAGAKLRFWSRDCGLYSFRIVQTTGNT